MTSQTRHAGLRRFIQFRPNFWVGVKGYELAIDGDGFRFFWPAGHWGWCKGAGFWGSSKWADIEACISDDEVS